MKKLLTILSLFFFIGGYSQTRYIPNNPDSVRIPISINNAVRWDYLVSLTRNRNKDISDSFNAHKFIFRNSRSNGITPGDTLGYIKSSNEFVLKRVIASTGILFSSTDSTITIKVDTTVIKAGSSAGGITKVLSSNVQVINTGNTLEDTVYAGTIPSNSIGVNGSFHVHWLTKAVGTVTFRLRLNGIQLGTYSGTNTAQKNETIISNRNSLTSQVSLSNQSSASTSFGNGTAGGISTYTIDTTQPIRFTVTMQNGTNTDTPSLEALEVLAVY